MLRSKRDRVLQFVALLLWFGSFSAETTLGQSTIKLDDLLASTDEILTAITEIRELQAKGPVNKGIRTKEQIEQFLIERIEQEFPREQIAADEKLLKRLGLIPANLKLYDFMLQLLTEQVAGYYDPGSKTFYLADWLPFELQRPVIAHELTHALQDQHFDLEEFLKPDKGNDDQSLARSSLIEGEAFYIMLAYSLQELGRNILEIPNIREANRAQMGMMDAQYRIFASAPAYLKETLLFPYSYGGEFIRVFLTKNPWSNLDQVYRDPPTSTEQVIHPLKYFQDRDDPTMISSEAVRRDIGERWSLVSSNVLGEFVTFLVLQQYVGEQVATKATEGWDGDRVELFSDEKGRELLVFHSVWDSPADAAEFYDAYASLVVKRYPTLEEDTSSDGTAGSRVGEWHNRTVRIRLELDSTFVRFREETP